MNRYQFFIFFTFLELSLGKLINIKRGSTLTFPLPEIPEGTSINEIEWKYYSNKTILLARIFLNKSQESKIYSRRTGVQTTDNGTLSMEDIKDEDSGNYSCTIIFQDHRTQTHHIYLQVLHDQYPEQHSPVQNSTSKPADPHDPDISLIAIPVCSALSVILIVAIIVIFWCRKKCCCTSKEPIYINKDVVRKTRK
ncbi:hypothetical protein IRJ41_002578 [Triplophysa rosa]|uniref:Ig-like domain-containing protein n=1 Tax=Triplophysa rosa TaxID=992332 RepID=A0A9W8C610_TRIRA|nr:hypothetical protein IRJ41_002578 [Triplophysa rosa]